MTLRYLAVVTMLAAIGAGLLGLRQQQLNDKHAIAQSHTRMTQDRERIKDLQVQIAIRATPEALNKSIKKLGLNLQPMTDRGKDENTDDGAAPADASEHVAPPAASAAPTDTEALDG